jgi:hypothetical protein
MRIAILECWPASTPGTRVTPEFHAGYG